MIISMDVEKNLWQISTLFIIKTLNKRAIEGIYLKVIKATYDKPTANTILNSENLKAFPLRSGIGIPILATFLQYNIGTPSHNNHTKTIRKEMKGIQIGKEVLKLSLFAEDMIPYTENPKDATKIKLLNY